MSKRHEYIRKYVEDMTSDLRNLVLVYGSEWRWILRSPANKPWFGPIEILVLSPGFSTKSIFVHGDIDPCLFANYSGGEGASAASAIFGWIGNKKIPDGYVLEKANIGMGRDTTPGAIEEFDYRLATIDIEEAIEELETERDAAENADQDEIANFDRRIETYEEALDIVAHDADPATYYRMFEHLYDGIEDVETIEHIGLRPSKRVVLAHGAIVRLRELLLEQEDEALW